MFEVLEHLDEPDVVLGEVKRVVAPSGVLHLSVPCEGNPLTVQGILRSVGWRGFELSFGHVQAFSKDSLERLLKEQGFQISSIRWSGHLFRQIVHCAYFVWLRLPGVSASNSVEGRLYAMPEGPFKRLLTAFKSIIACLFFFGILNAQFRSRINSAHQLPEGNLRARQEIFERICREICSQLETVDLDILTRKRPGGR
jgi:SAM-dependent methyltransferase